MIQLRFYKSAITLTLFMQVASIADAQDPSLNDTTQDFFIQPWIWSIVGIVVFVALLFTIRRQRKLAEDDREAEPDEE